MVSAKQHVGDNVMSLGWSSGEHGRVYGLWIRQESYYNAPLKKIPFWILYTEYKCWIGKALDDQVKWYSA